MKQSLTSYGFLIPLALIIALNGSCTTQRAINVETPAQRVVRTAMEYEGTPYRYGGESRAGMDCSGLVYVVMNGEGIHLPRTSLAMSEEGEKLNLSEVQPGDLLFFRTERKRNRVSHVGLVVEVGKEGVRFIHSTTQRGVIVSSLNEPYWNKAFKRARRVL